MADTLAEDADNEDGEVGDEEPMPLSSKAGAAKKKRKEKLFKVSSLVLAGGKCVLTCQAKPQAQTDGADSAARLCQNASLACVRATNEIPLSDSQGALDDNHQAWRESFSQG